MKIEFYELENLSQATCTELIQVLKHLVIQAPYILLKIVVSGQPTQPHSFRPVSCPLLRNCLMYKAQFGLRTNTKVASTAVTIYRW